MKAFIYIYLLLATTLMASCNENSYFPSEIAIPTEPNNTMNSLWGLSPIEKDISKRKVELDKIQLYSDKCAASLFKSYLSTDKITADAIEKHEDIVICYKMAFNKVLEEVKSTKVPNGQSVIWQIYNMGYVIKTPDACFGVDICNREAELFAPYLDFYCSTHKHADHYNIELMNAMHKAGKPVISNFYEPSENYSYFSKENSSFNIGNIKINSFITDHNNATLKNFVTVFEIDCGDNSGNFVFTHVGDSNYNPSQFRLTTNASVFIPRYAVNELTENNIISTITNPKYVLLSHILELSHDGIDESRWSIELGLKRAQLINNPNTFMPFWGDKMIWNGDVLL